MIRKIRVNELENYIDKEIVFSGFVDAIRDKKWVMFVILRDETGIVQLISEEVDKYYLINKYITSNNIKSSFIFI